MENVKSLRIVFWEWDGEILRGMAVDNRRICLVCNPGQRAELEALGGAIVRGVIFNLLNFTESEGVQRAEFLVFEPDYLLDVSALAECFRPYGHHPLNYVLARMRERELSSYLLLGNMANAFVDAFVYEEGEGHVDYPAMLRRLFHGAAFEFTACRDLEAPRKADVFFANCRRQFDSIRHVVRVLFPKVGFDRERVLLEPAFVSNALGVQGRLDILLDDGSGFIELKSGKAAEGGLAVGRFERSAENHFIQVTLYLAMLEFVLGLEPDLIRSYLLYSKYPVLSEERHSRVHLGEALGVRNRIVAMEYVIQRENRSEVTLRAMGQMDASVLNTRGMRGRFFDCYLAPGLNGFAEGFRGLSPLEQSYFLRVYTFVVKELWLSKAGVREYEGVKMAANLWGASFEDKVGAGELLYDLRITDNGANEEPPRLTLAVPEYREGYCPNFRAGDVVVLYEREGMGDSVMNHQVFKASIERMEGQVLVLRLRYRQRNVHIWRQEGRYAVEHDSMDIAFHTMFRGLDAFVHANGDRRDLLLGRSRTDEVSLVVGPPGTGKTSMVLKRLVEEAWCAGDGNMLLLAYTNRAVDEICKALDDMEARPPYMRIGSELNCAPEYRSHLQKNFLAGCARRSEVAELLQQTRIFVGTAASIGGRMELFQMKHFDLVVIDEATQLLEPQLLGIFCARNPLGLNAAKRFVLIGDHKQLPAVVLQSKEDSSVLEAALNAMGLVNLSDSLFERFYRRYRQEGRADRIRFLSQQGRMHPEIAAFPSRFFYEGKLECAGLPHQMEQWEDRKRIRFYPVLPDGNERANKTNRREAEQVVAICRALREESLERGEVFVPGEVGIITPFRNQMALIRRLLVDTGVVGFADMLVDTVERFQGSQRDVIIYSFCIRSESQLEALPNWLEVDGRRMDRKLNVVLTRARKQLHVVGNKGLLRKNGLYGELIDYMEG
jgi:hypothetical protein